jgi:hypothetical protein
MSVDREECVYMAKLAEQAERYDEMVTEMQKVMCSEISTDCKLEVCLCPACSPQ